MIIIHVVQVIVMIYPFSTAPKSPAVAAKFGSHEETDQPAADQSGGRPHPPPPPQSSTTPTKPPTTTYTSVTYPPPPMKCKYVCVCSFRCVCVFMYGNIPDERTTYVKLDL